jgi:hypothetical protein
MKRKPIKLLETSEKELLEPRRSSFSEFSGVAIPRKKKLEREDEL